MACNKHQIQEENGIPHNLFSIMNHLNITKYALFVLYFFTFYFFWRDNTRLKKPCLPTDDNEVQDALLRQY